MDKHRAWATGDLPLTLSKSTHMHKARKEEADWGVRLLLIKPPPPATLIGQNAKSPEPGTFSRLHRTFLESVSWSGGPGGRYAVSLDDDSNVNSKMLPSPLKYSRCPSMDVKTLHKPPINFYGGLRSRLRIITFIFTRQGTQTTGQGGEQPGQCSLTQRSRLMLPSLSTSGPQKGSQLRREAGH